MEATRLSRRQTITSPPLTYGRENQKGSDHAAFCLHGQVNYVLELILSVQQLHSRRTQKLPH